MLQAFELAVTLFLAQHRASQTVLYSCSNLRAAQELRCRICARTRVHTRTHTHTHTHTHDSYGTQLCMQMGKLLKRLGNLRAAQEKFEMALAFNSSSADAGLIKAAIEKLAVNEEDVEDEL